MDNTLFLNPDSADVTTKAPLIAIKFYESGYFPIYSNASADDLNGGPIDPEVIQSAVIGSMFGWDVPGAKTAHDYFLTNKSRR